jgi:hypothetical protein
VAAGLVIHNPQAGQSAVKSADRVGWKIFSWLLTPENERLKVVSKECAVIV